MSLELDAAVRINMFERIRQLRDAGGGFVSAAQLNEGIHFRGARVPIWNQQTGIFRPRLLRAPGAALTIQTSFESPYEDRWSPDDDVLAYKYRGTNQDHSDNRALRRAMELRLPLLYLVGVNRGIYEPVFPSYVVADDPSALTFSLLADEEEFIRPGADRSDSDAPRKAYITRRVKQRLHQERFRFQVIGAYRNQCSMCRLRHVSLLEAAHIIPDRDPHGMPEVPNGLSLCRIHHGAFDVGILGVDPDYQIHLRKDVLEEHDGPMLRHGLQELHGGRILVPRIERHRPNPTYLRARFAKFRAA
jgi:putative restriction endonuclease